jgi:hypothetical protein
MLCLDQRITLKKTLTVSIIMTTSQTKVTTRAEAHSWLKGIIEWPKTDLKVRIVAQSLIKTDLSKHLDRSEHFINNTLYAKVVQETLNSLPLIEN